MKSTKKIFLTIIISCCLDLLVLSQAMAVNAKFDLNKFSDMSDFDPNKQDVTPFLA